MYRHILIATDGSELAEGAVRQGTALAKALGADVTLVTVTEPWRTTLAGEAAIVVPHEEYTNAVAASAATVLANAKALATAAGIDAATIHVAEQFPAEGIVETARKRNCDLIVMATHGRRGISRMLLGSQTNRTVVQSPVPVLVCR
jgi:nucleotide-binding universal stress UspA family protein